LTGSGRTTITARAGLSRRQVLRSSAAGAAAMAVAPLLSACGTKPAATSTLPPDRSTQDKSVGFSNWALYIDVDEKDPSKHPTLDAFTASTGIAVTYTEDINDPDELNAKMVPSFQAGQDTGHDILVPTEEIATKWLRAGYVETLDKSLLPNVTANLIDSLAHPAWDKDRTFTVPWQSGCTGIAYDAAKVKPVRTITELLTRPDLKGKVALIHDWRDTAALVMLDMGVDISSYTDDQFFAACEVVQKAVDSGQVRKFTGGDYTELLANGSVDACLAWSGDIVQLQYDTPSVTYAIPEAGQLIWADAMVIPQQAQHRANAHALMNYYYDPKVAAQVTATVQYICPVKGAREEMATIDKTLVDNPLIFPDADFLRTTHTSKLIDEATQSSYTAAWVKVTGG
jgi:spermidine/putrescine transport system substrate-binding protein